MLCMPSIMCHPYLIVCLSSVLAASLSGMMTHDLDSVCDLIHHHFRFACYLLCRCPIGALGHQIRAWLFHHLGHPLLSIGLPLKCWRTARPSHESSPWIALPSVSPWKDIALSRPIKQCWGNTPSFPELHVMSGFPYQSIARVVPRRFWPDERSRAEARPSSERGTP
jgi:hypothetical protein